MPTGRNVGTWGKERRQGTQTHQEPTPLQTNLLSSMNPHDLITS
jgi:hypothetical protein